MPNLVLPERSLSFLVRLVRCDRFGYAIVDIFAFIHPKFDNRFPHSDYHSDKI